MTARSGTFVLATGNADKVVEIASILRDVELLPRPADLFEPEESGASLEENARLKARAVLELTGLPAIADDTGLEVDALGGEPGVRSSRFAGEKATYADNVKKLLSEMERVPLGQRGARFRTVAVALFPDGGEMLAEGSVEGVITDSPRGDDGFGYDPVFEPLDSGGLTFAEMPFDDKNALSHRGRAFRLLAEKLAAYS